MSMTADKSAPNSLGEGLKMLSAKWGWIVALGIVFMIAGVVALGSVVAATESAVLIVGIMMIMGGAAELFAAFSVKSWGKFAFWLLLGALALLVVAGVMTTIGKTNFAASYAEDALAGRFWYFGWIPLMASGFGVIASLASGILRRLR